MYIIGIDFGHGETSAAIINTDGTKKKPEDIRLRGGDAKTLQNCVVPSILIKRNNENDWSLFSRYNDIYNTSSIKSHFKGPISGHNGFKEIDKEQKACLATFAKLIFNRIKQQYKDLETTPYKIFLACPSGWTEEMQSEYQQFFAHNMNSNVCGVIPESMAALCNARYGNAFVDDATFNASKTILIIDFGSSTIDLSFLNLNDGKIQNDTIILGGHEVERAIYNYMLEKEKSTKTVINQIKEQGYNIPTIEEKLLFELRLQKESYYYGASAGIGFIPLNKITGNPSLRDLALCPDSNELYNEEQIEEILYSYKQSLRTKLKDYYFSVLNKQNIDELVITGGVSRMKFVRDICKDIFNPQFPHPNEEPELSVSRGLAMLGTIPPKSLWIEEKKTEVKIIESKKVEADPNKSKSIIDIISKVKSIPIQKISDGNSLQFLGINEKDLKLIVDGYSDTLNHPLSIEQKNSLTSPAMLSISLKNFMEYCKQGYGPQLQNSNSVGTSGFLDPRVLVAFYQILKMFIG